MAKDHNGKTRRRAKNSEEILEIDSPYVLLVFPGNEGLHGFSPQVVVKFVNVQDGLVRFPRIA